MIKMEPLFCRENRCRNAHSLPFNNYYRTDGTHPVIILTSTVLVELKRGILSARFFLMHELGHYYYGHLEQPPTLEDEFLKRKAALSRGIVPQEELEADCFAVRCLGAENVRLALQEEMEKRMAYDLMCGVASDPISELALREYQLRLDAICTDTLDI